MNSSEHETLGATFHMIIVKIAFIGRMTISRMFEAISTTPADKFIQEINYAVHAHSAHYGIGKIQ
jgi:hypothetical protein